MGSYYFDPQFAIGSGGGLPGFDTHDVAVIIFGEPGVHRSDRSRQDLPVRADTVLGDARPVRGPARPWASSTRLPMGTSVDLVGYGVQNFVNGGGPCGPNCKKSPGGRDHPVLRGDDPDREQQLASATSSSSCTPTRAAPASVIPVGPNLLGGTNIVLAVNSFVANAICSGNTYSYRVDTAEALTWITATVNAHGASL